jgi:hypothetical protein
LRTSTANSGMAMIVIWSPTSEATWPVQKRRKVTLVRNSAGAATTGQPSSRG